MKSFIVFAIAAIVVVSATPFTEEQLAKGKELAAACAQEQGVDPSAVEKLKGGDFSNSDKKLQCFTNCFLEKAGFIKDGQMQENVVLEKLSTTTEKDKVQKLIDTCKNTTGADNCEKAYNLFKCYQENKP